VTADRDATVRDYWRERLRQHTGDSYAGVPLLKFPEDLRVYEHLLWESQTDAVIEIGCRYGGSALWFRDRLLANARYGRIGANPVVISVDLETDEPRRWLQAADSGWEEHIRLVQGDVTDPVTADRVAALLPAGARTLVVEDSEHIAETTLGSLENYAGFVGPGGFLVVEDGVVDIDDLRFDWMPRGVLATLDAWLATEQGAAFRIREDLNLYGVTSHPRGFLQRVG
jgi:cephalosporin hydroxylase